VRGTPRTTVIRASSHFNGPIILENANPSLTGLVPSSAAGDAFIRTWEFGHVIIEGTNVAATAAYNTTTQAHGAGIGQEGIRFDGNGNGNLSGCHFHDVSVRRTSSVAIQFVSEGEAHFFTAERIKVCPPRGAVANNVPWIHFKGANNNHSWDQCVLTHDSWPDGEPGQLGTIGNIPAAGAVRMDDGPVNVPGFLNFSAWSLEGMSMATGSAVFHFGGVRCQLVDPLFIDEQKIAGATDYHLVRITPSVVANLGSNEIKGGAYGGVMAVVVYSSIIHCRSG
jgi:hypothetical protein